MLYTYVTEAISVSEVYRVLFLGTITAIRVLVLIFLCTLLWVPVGVWIGLRPTLSKYIQPLVQVLAAFPANLLFPVVVVVILRYDLNVEIWVTPLMVLGTQWYILFNVIAGTRALPKELYLASENFNLRGWLWWRRLVLPGIFPYYITGAMAAAGGAWNASIVAEFVEWGGTELQATGIGAYIHHYTAVGDFHRIALGTGVMCGFVLVLNRLIWRPLYLLAEKRYQFSVS